MKHLISDFLQIAGNTPLLKDSLSFDDSPAYRKIFCQRGLSHAAVILFFGIIIPIMEAG